MKRTGLTKRAFLMMREGYHHTTICDVLGISSDQLRAVIHYGSYELRTKGVL